MGDHDLQGGDVVVFTHEVVDGGFFVDGEDAVHEGVSAPEDNILDV